MICTGLVSVTFRKLKPEEIVELMKRAGLDGIEWGGDIHVPHGDIKQAARVLKLTRDAGLKVASYGSYYKVGEDNDFDFCQVLDTAKALEAPVIRVWAGKLGSEKAEDKYWDNVVNESQSIAEAAAKENIKVAFEFHGNTLTDTNASALKLLREVNHDNIKSYWQPSLDMRMEERLEGLKEILPWLLHIHTFYWKVGQRLELESGLSEWQEYMKIIQKAKGNRYAMIEFVKDDSPQQFLEDASALRKLVSY
jgi:3-dehydroshikimate dehydratase